MPQSNPEQVSGRFLGAPKLEQKNLVQFAKLGLTRLLEIIDERTLALLQQSGSAVAVYVTGDHSVGSESHVVVDATSGAVDVVVPGPTSVRQIEVTKEDASANPVTITPSSGTISGSASVQLTGQWDGVSLRATGREWVIV